MTARDADDETDPQAEAAGRNILIPALIENVSLPIEFKRIQSANLSTWNGEETPPEFRNLLAAVDSILANSSSVKTTGSRIETDAVDSCFPGRSRRFPFVSAACALGLVTVAGSRYFL